MILVGKGVFAYRWALRTMTRVLIRDRREKITTHAEEKNM